MAVGDLVYDVIDAVSSKRHEAQVIGVRMSPAFKRELDADAAVAFGPMTQASCPTGSCTLRFTSSIAGASIYLDDTIEGYVVETIPFEIGGAGG